MSNTRASFLWGLFVLQIFCVSFFLLDVVGDVPTGTVEINEQDGNIIADYFEALITMCLVLSTIFSGIEIRSLYLNEKYLRMQIGVASGAFGAVIEKQFEEWELTEAESAVALLGIKGYSIKEIAKMRNTAEGTIKAQNASVYRKADVSGRLQLMSHFVEDLVADIDVSKV